MFLRIERLLGEEGTTVLRLSGRIGSEHVAILSELLMQEEGKVAIDLTEVTLINHEAVIFLALTEADGVELRNCTDYIREWIRREGDRK